MPKTHPFPIVSETPIIASDFYCERFKCSMPVFTCLYRQERKEIPCDTCEDGADPTGRKKIKEEMASTPAGRDLTRKKNAILKSNQSVRLIMAAKEALDSNYQRYERQTRLEEDKPDPEVKYCVHCGENDFTKFYTSRKNCCITCYRKQQAVRNVEANAARRAQTVLNRKKRAMMQEEAARLNREDEGISMEDKHDHSLIP